MLTKIYCEVDDFCKDFQFYWKNYALSNCKSPTRKVRVPSLSLSEVLTIIIYFQLSKYRTFKDYYCNYISVYRLNEFPDLVSYTYFLELKQRALFPLLVFIRTCRLGKCTGISFVDSTKLSVCLNQRIHNHKTFESSAKRGKTSTGWFFGFKIHLVINDKGELLSFVLTPGNIDDRNRNVMKKLTDQLFGKLYGDKGYLGQKLFDELFEKGVKLITKLKKNMKPKLIDYVDRILLRKRVLIETIIDQLKNICQIEHSRHRNPINFLVNVFSALTAYTFFEKKPKLNFPLNGLQLVL